MFECLNSINSITYKKSYFTMKLFLLDEIIFLKLLSEIFLLKYFSIKYCMLVQYRFAIQLKFWGQKKNIFLSNFFCNETIRNVLQM